MISSSISSISSLDSDSTTPTLSQGTTYSAPRDGAPQESTSGTVQVLASRCEHNEYLQEPRIQPYTGPTLTYKSERCKCPVVTSIWNCRICKERPIEPVAMLCGHVFCHWLVSHVFTMFYCFDCSLSCIIQELANNLRCPVCNTVILLRLRID